MQASDEISGLGKLGWVYVFGVPGDRFKVGFTRRSVKLRLREGKVWLHGTPGAVLIAEGAGDRMMERRLHRILSAARIDGEWFRWEGLAADLGDALISESVTLDAWVEAHGS